MPHGRGGALRAIASLGAGRGIAMSLGWTRLCVASAQLYGTIFIFDVQIC